MFEILLIEDDATDAERLREALNALNLPLNTVISDSEDALDLLRMNARFSEALRPDLILLNLNSRNTSGMEILEELRSHSTLQRIPVIMLTQPDDPLDTGAGFELSISHIMSKPCHSDGYNRLTESVVDLVRTTNPELKPPAA